MTRPRSLLVLVVVVFGVVALGCGKDSATSSPPDTTAKTNVKSTATWSVAPATEATTATTATTASAGPPCTLEAINDGVTAAGRTLADPPRFSCVGNWATAIAPTPVILEGNGPRWAVVDAATVCPTRDLPPSIRDACSPG